MRMTIPSFSVITCTRNSEPWLSTSISSVLSQQAVDIEYIFVDGKSSDGTLERIRHIDRPYTLIENQCEGISSAMNAGLQSATRDIVAFLHSDDFYLHPNVLQIVAEQFQTSHCEWLFGRTMIMANGQLAPENYVAPRFSRHQLLRGNFIPHPACFVKRELLMQVGGFDPALRYAMDYDLWLRLSLISNPLPLTLPLAVFREHAGSLSTRDRAAAMREDLHVRMFHTGPHPIDKLIHVARYGVRCGRAVRRRLSEAVRDA